MVRPEVAGRERPLRRQEVSRTPMTWHLAGGTPDTRGRSDGRMNASRATRRACCSPPWMPASPRKSSAPSPQAGHVVVSNSRNHRMERDVPLLVPEINPDHLQAGPRPAARARLEGADRHQSELLHHRADDGAGAAQAVRHHQGDRHHHAGHLRRGLSRRAVHGHQWAT